LDGGAGRDRLTGGSGRDTLLGGFGRGRDLFFAHDGFADVVAGGGGRDVAHADPVLDRVNAVELRLR
jgi:hypothetical protein